MARRRYPIAELAREANLSVDDALLRLLDADVLTSIEESASIAAKDLKVVKQLLGIATRGDLTSQEYWQRRLDLSDSDFQFLLARLDVVALPGSRRLPRGSVGKLKAEWRRHHPHTPKAIERDVNVVAQQVVQDYPWHIVGDEREVRFLTTDEIRRIHYALVDDFSSYDDPISPSGVRDEVLLEGAAYRPHTSLDSHRKYPTIEMASAALVHSLVHNHPFHNGNKRTALVAMLVFLDENGMMLMCGEDSLFDFVLQVAEHRIGDQHQKVLADQEVLEMARWIRRNTRLVEKGDRPLPFRSLRRILVDFGCTLDDPIGSHVNITRLLPRRRFLPLPSPKLATQVHYDGEGREVAKNSVSKIRRDLQLNEEHGVDSRTFYEKAPASVGDFIVGYRKTLRRLAKL